MNVFGDSWFVMLGYLFLIKPGVISGIPTLAIIDTAFDVCRIALIALTVLDLLVVPIDKHDSKLTVILLIFAAEAWKILSTMIAGHGYSDWGAIMNTVGIVLFTYSCLRADQGNFLAGASKVLGFYVLLNTATVLFFPNGLYATTQYTQNYFLSYRTAWFPIYLLAAVLVMLNAEANPSQRARTWRNIILAAIFLSLCAVWTATGIFCFSIAAIMFFVCWKYRNGKAVNGRWILLAEGIIFLLMVVLRLQEKFAFILVGILKKDITMTARLRIWDNAIKSISSHLLTGIGNLGNTEMKSILGFGATHAHNYFLNTALCYGIIGVVLSLTPICYTMSRKYENALIALISSCACLALLTAYQVECYMTIGYYLLPIYLVLCDINGITDDPGMRREAR